MAFRTPSAVQTLTAHETGLVEGSLHSWDICTGVDGPGTRFVVFTAGCPLRCLYCHNPDAWRMRAGERVTAEQVLNRMERYVRYLRAAGGGVTVSGGEPLLQSRFTEAILPGAHDLGLHTALDTAGSLGDRVGDEMLAVTDLVLLDIKSSDPARTTGGDRRQPHPDPRVRPAARRGRHPGLGALRAGARPHRRPRERGGLARFVAGLSNVERVDVLGYHWLGREKYAALGLPDLLEGVPGATPEQIRAAREIFADAGPAVT